MRMKLASQAPQAIHLLNERGYLVVVVTNQSGIARGLFTEKEYLAFTRWIAEEAMRKGARIDSTYYCPHHPDGVVPEYRTQCGCRKPSPELFLTAIEDLEIDPATSIAIGDSQRDITAAEAAGVPAFLFDGGDLLSIVRSVL